MSCFLKHFLNAFLSEQSTINNQLINQICFKIPDMIILAINCHLVTKTKKQQHKRNHFDFKTWMYYYIFIYRFSSQGNKYSLKMATTIQHSSKKKKITKQLPVWHAPSSILYFGITVVSTLPKNTHGEILGLGHTCIEDRKI